jgi:hypothetical protein
MTIPRLELNAADVSARHPSMEEAWNNLYNNLLLFWFKQRVNFGDHDPPPSIIMSETW